MKTDMANRGRGPAVDSKKALFKSRLGRVESSNGRKDHQSKTPIVLQSLCAILAIGTTHLRVLQIHYCTLFGTS